jgi:hypothetical protein
MCGWLSGDAFSEFFAILRSDPELSVRKAAERAYSERRERSWARAYLGRVREVRGTTIEEMVAAWRYGQALIAVGDDECVRLLRTHVESEARQPHVQHWVEYVIDGLEKRWRKITQEWPEPWLAFEGVLRQGEGTLVLPDGRSMPVVFSLWSQPASAPGEQSIWGGPMREVPMGTAPNCKLDLDERTSREIVLTGKKNNMATFLGKGSYPDL